jgi:hypothetical protein
MYKLLEHEFAYSRLLLEERRLIERCIGARRLLPVNGEKE